MWACSSGNRVIGELEFTAGCRADETGVNNSQRTFLIGACILLAIGLVLFCFDYRVVPDDTLEGSLLIQIAQTPGPQRELFEQKLESDAQFRGLIPVIDFGAVKLTTPDWPQGYLPTEKEFFDAFTPRHRALFPRLGLTRLDAEIGGVLAPLLLAIAAGYLMLGIGKKSLVEEPRFMPAGNAPIAPSILGREGMLSAPAISPRPQAIANSDKSSEQSSLSAIALTEKLAQFGMAIFPVLLVIDLQSMMLLSRFKYPRWVFVVHCLYAMRVRY